jgi:hypothetical protein
MRFLCLSAVRLHSTRHSRARLLMYFVPSLFPPFLHHADDDVEYSIYSFRKPNQRDAFILGEVSFYTAGAAGLLALAAIKIKT